MIRKMICAACLAVSCLIIVGCQSTSPVKGFKSEMKVSKGDEPGTFFVYCKLTEFNRVEGQSLDASDDESLARGDGTETLTMPKIPGKIGEKIIVASYSSHEGGAYLEYPSSNNPPTQDKDKRVEDEFPLSFSGVFISVYIPESNKGGSGEAIIHVRSDGHTKYLSRHEVMINEQEN